MPNSVFDVVGNNRNPIPHHKRHEMRVFIGGMVTFHRVNHGCESMKALATETGVRFSVISALESGKECPTITIEVLERIARAIGCELKLEQGEDECFYGATTTMEELLVMGISPIFSCR